MSEIEPGDVAYVVGCGPQGLSIVMEVSGDRVTLHDGKPMTRVYFTHRRWCHRVGRVDGDISAKCWESHRVAKQLDDERDRRQAEAEEAARQADPIAQILGRLDALERRIGDDLRPT
jgi:hypothetical protein